jgi:hypothetical protein
MFLLAWPSNIWIYRHAQRVSIPSSTHRHGKLGLKWKSVKSKGTSLYINPLCPTYKAGRKAFNRDVELCIVLRLLAQADFWQIKRWPALNKPDVMTLAIINFSTMTHLLHVRYHLKILFLSLGILPLFYGRYGVSHHPHGYTLVVSYTIDYSALNKKQIRSKNSILLG